MLRHRPASRGHGSVSQSFLEEVDCDRVTRKVSRCCTQRAQSPWSLGCPNTASPPPGPSPVWYTGKNMRTKPHLWVLISDPALRSVCPRWSHLLGPKAGEFTGTWLVFAFSCFPFLSSLCPSPEPSSSSPTPNPPGPPEPQDVMYFLSPNSLPQLRHEAGFCIWSAVLPAPFPWHPPCGVQTARSRAQPRQWGSRGQTKTGIF